MNDKIVTIVLSTYNGAPFIDAFLASLAAQTHRPDRIVMRDDGSTDNTVECICQWAERESIELLINNEFSSRLGPARSFLAVLGASGASDLYLFADQDDVWLPEKIQRAMDHLVTGASASPMLYASRLTIVDSSLRVLGHSKIPSHISFPNAMAENCLTGCSMAFNQGFADLINIYSPSNAIMHDWWCYLIAAALGAVVFDEEPSILYRQHAANAVGEGPHGLSLLLRRIKRFFRGEPNRRSAQLAEFMQAYGKIFDKKTFDLAQSVLDSRTSLAARIRATCFCPIPRRTLIDKIGIRGAIFFNRY